MRHVILSGVAKDRSPYSGRMDTYEFYQTPKVSGTQVHFDGTDKGAIEGYGYKNLKSARAAFSRHNPVRGGYRIKWTKEKEPLSKMDVYRLREETNEQQQAEQTK